MILFASNVFNMIESEKKTKTCLFLSFEELFELVIYTNSLFLISLLEVSIYLMPMISWPTLHQMSLETLEHNRNQLAKKAEVKDIK